MGLYAYMQQVLADRPHLYSPGWKKHPNVGSQHRDFTNLNADATEAGTNPTVTPGPFGGHGSDFPAVDTNSRIEFADSSFLDCGDTFSVEGWVKITTSGIDQTIASKGNNAYQLVINSLDNLDLNKEASTNLARSSKSLALNVWYYCVGTKSGSTSFVYLNGANDTASGTNSVCANNSDVFRIGNRAGSLGSQVMRGEIAHVAVYPYALSPGQIRAHYQAAIGRPGAKFRRM